jgi:geranylgeranyl diphosphate synthase, type I
VSDPLDVEDLRARVQQALDDHLGYQEHRLAELGPRVAPLLDTIRSLLAGGKRLRAAFAYWGWRGAGGEPCDGAVQAAAAVEMFQAAALLHDDVMDASDTRRGRPTAHRRMAALHRDRRWSGSADRFGTAAAVLAGDLCLAWSDELLARSGLPSERLAAGRDVFDLMRTQLMGGQYLDVLAQALPEAEGGGTVDGARHVIRFKSAKYTVEHPLLLGGRLAAAPDALLSAYSAYGLPLGEAFQLRDDLLGVYGEPAETGKPAGDDLREGKRTVLMAEAFAAASAGQLQVLRRRFADPGLDDEGVACLQQLLVDTGAVRAVEELIERLARDARQALAASATGEPARSVLDRLVEAATVRRT